MMLNQAFEQRGETGHRQVSGTDGGSVGAALRTCSGRNSVRPRKIRAVRTYDRQVPLAGIPMRLPLSPSPTLTALLPAGEWMPVRHRERHPPAA